MRKTIFNKAIYWHDPLDKKEEKIDLRTQVLCPCERVNISLKKVKCFDIPQALDEICDILFFDWGGMSLGNSLMEHFCSYILKRAEDTIT